MSGVNKRVGLKNLPFLPSLFASLLNDELCVLTDLICQDGNTVCIVFPTLSWMRFSRMFSSAIRQKSKYLRIAPCLTSLLPILSNRRNTRGKWPLKRNHEGNWRRRQIDVMLLWPYPAALKTSCMWSTRSSHCRSCFLDKNYYYYLFCGFFTIFYFKNVSAQRMG